MNTVAADLLLDSHAVLGEGPRWDARHRLLAWVDIPGSAVHVADQRIVVGRRITALAPLGDEDGWLCAADDALATLRVTDGVADLAERVRLDLPSGVRLNDGACDPAGRFWVGSMHEGAETDAGALWCFDGTTPELRLDGVGLSNGIGWSPDGRWMYFNDTLTQRVDRFAFDVDTGRLGARSVLAEVPGAEGAPDGLSVDHDGNVWVCLFDGGKVLGLRPDGERFCEVRLPVTKVTACCFGGDDGAMLLITTASEELTAGERRAQPHAGGLFVADVGATGPPAQPFIAT